MQGQPEFTMTLGGSHFPHIMLVSSRKAALGGGRAEIIQVHMN